MYERMHRLLYSWCFTAVLSQEEAFEVLTYFHRFCVVLFAKYVLHIFSMFFPDMVQLLEIYLILPVSIASAERSFSVPGWTIRPVLPRYTAPYTMPYYCAQDYGVVRLIYGRKIGVFSSFSDRKCPVNDAVLIDLGYWSC